MPDARWSLIGKPIPKAGAVYTAVFLNNGLAKNQAEAIVSIMPTFGELSQGKKTASGQFDYRYNTDFRTIIGALASFHGNLSVIAFATSQPDLYEPPLRAYPRMVQTRPEELLGRLKRLPDRPQSFEPAADR